uniref:Teratocarcinoma-derived growth factor n=1 Tax=Magallana gigas TaxID=29159 RepID=K1R5K1_MAGGI
MSSSTLQPFEKWAGLKIKGFNSYKEADVTYILRKLKKMDTLCLIVFFIGRYCQYHLEHKACRHVPHGYWIRSDCDKCRCFNGRIFCIPKYYFGCDDDDEPLDSTRTVDPFRGKTITLFSKDPDVHHSLIPDTDVAPTAAENYDDEYYYSDNMAASAARAVFPLFIYALMLPLVIL